MENLTQELAASDLDLEGLNYAPIQVWEAHPIISKYLDLSDRKIAAAIDKAIEIKESTTPAAPTGYALDMSDEAAFGYASGDRNWLGLAIVPSHRETLFIVCRVAYEDKDLAKAQGAKWDRKVGWHWEIADMKAACNQIKKVLADEPLASAIAIKGEINLYCTKKSDFNRHWCAEVAGASIPKAIAAKPESLEDIVISRQAAEDLEKESKWFCGLAESEYGIAGFAIKAPFQMKEQIKWIASYSGGGNAKWLPDSKRWLIPLDCAEMLDPTHRHHLQAVEFFQGFTFSVKAKPYFESAIASNLI